MKTTTFAFIACMVATLGNAADVNALARRHKSDEARATPSAILAGNTHILNTMNGTAAATLMLAGSTPSLAATAKPSSSTKAVSGAANGAASSSKHSTSHTAASTGAAAATAGAAATTGKPSSLPSSSVVHTGAATGWDVNLGGFKGWLLSVLFVALVPSTWRISGREYAYVDRLRIFVHLCALRSFDSLTTPEVLEVQRSRGLKHLIHGLNLILLLGEAIWELMVTCPVRVRGLVDAAFEALLHVSVELGL
ncbi:hypothetical protein Micbo1qcDRAFT_173758 [Microdochium bolleyi]|uniref:Uncharacterized protein n=1 Tax=Microdochium bolleyi TaxID=196109 RepID=A0A136J629_9PEZI|nr:hypothetical protein Micbo1qcDRAFT_173758 [Microdochium bolleyi]